MCSWDIFVRVGNPNLTSLPVDMVFMMLAISRGTQTKGKKNYVRPALGNKNDGFSGTRVSLLGAKKLSHLVEM